MRLSPGNWSTGKKVAAAMLLVLLLLVLGTGFEDNKPMLTDRFLWPKSAHERIENMASIIRRIKSPARWCDRSNNPENIYDFDPKEEEQDFGRCLSAITPVSDFRETSPGHYIKRFYRAEIGDKFCEVTLSTVFEDDRIVGSDCFFGFFPKARDTGIGMTDDKFG
ncbi:hypothetical protein [Rhizobium sp.]